MANVVVVKISISATTSTPVYFAIMGVAARSVTVSRWALTPAQRFLPHSHVKGHQVDRGQRLCRAAAAEMIVARFPAARSSVATRL